MSRTHVALLVAFATLAALVIGLLVYGLSTHREGGWLDGGPPWPRSSMPLPVAAVDAEPGDLDTLRAAVDAINERAGMHVFVLECAPVSALVTVAFHTPVGGDGLAAPGGDAPRHTGPLHGRCDVRIGGVRNELAWLVVEHELGHCLGLAHDDAQTSIMRPVQIDTPWGDLPPRLSDHDVALLRGAYGAQ